MVGQTPLVNANLLSLALESFLYGNFFVLAVLSTYLLVSHHRSPQTGVRGRPEPYWRLIKKPMFLTAVVLSMTCTAHWTINVTRAFLAFIESTGKAGVLAFYADLSQLTQVVKTGFLAASLCTGDAAIIYRLWIIYGRSPWVVIFPIGTLTGLIICGIGITFQFAISVPGEDVFESAAGRWITSDCVFTLFTNVYSTVAIAVRVWNTHRRTQTYGGVSVMPVVATVIESAALYTTWTILFFISYQSGSNLQFPAADIWPLMSGIAFMLINVRVGLGWDAKARSRGALSSGSGQQGTSLPSARLPPISSPRPHWDHPYAYGPAQDRLGPVTGKGRDVVLENLRVERSLSYGDFASPRPMRPARPVEVNISQVIDTDEGPISVTESKATSFGYAQLQVAC